MMIKDIGKQVEKVWQDLRPVTQKILVGAMQPNLIAVKQKFAYDIQSDWELSALLTALDQQSETTDEKKKLAEIKQMADACVKILQSQTESAEVFIQLAERLLKEKEFSKIDALADSLQERFSTGEICEIVRQAKNQAIRAIAQEALAFVPIPSLMQLIDDSLYQEIVENTLAQKAFEFESDEARQILEQMGLADEFEQE